MAISITTSEIKRKAMIAESNSDYDSAISALIAEMQGPIEFSIADCFYNDTANAKLQATLKLGILEIITGEFLEQLRRETGSTEEFSIGGCSVGETKVNGASLIQQGRSRLAPFQKGALPTLTDSKCASTTQNSPSVFSLEEEVW